MSSSVSVNLLDLAASLLVAAVLASGTIREYSQPLDTENSDDEGQDSRKNPRLKDDGTFVTDADFACQGIIIEAIRNVSSEVRIVGEENEEDVAAHMTDESPSTKPYNSLFKLAQREVRIRYNQLDDPPPLAPKAINKTKNSENQEQIIINNEEDNETRPLPEISPSGPSEYLADAKRVVVFIDPLDGTKAYAKGDHDPVSVLIAIVLDGKPCFGVICKPFGCKGQVTILDSGCTAIYGGVLVGGVFAAGGGPCFPPKIVSNKDDKSSLPRAIISSSRSKGVVENFVEFLGAKGIVHPEPLLISGAGEKSLRIILRTQSEGLWFFPKPGTSLWDVAASDAILRSVGGKLTDKYGNPLDYSKSRAHAENSNGIIACYDSELHDEIIRLFQEGDWAE